MMQSQPEDFDDWELTDVRSIYYSKTADSFVYADEAHNWSGFFPTLGHAVQGLNYYVNNYLNVTK